MIATNIKASKLCFNIGALIRNLKMYHQSNFPISYMFDYYSTLTVFHIGFEVHYIEKMLVYEHFIRDIEVMKWFYSKANRALWYICACWPFAIYNYVTIVINIDKSGIIHWISIFIFFMKITYYCSLFL